MSKKKRVTIRDVAEEAGVSPTAVSFAFNSPEQLSRATHERILKVAARLKYQPHPVARTLATGRTGTLGLVLPADLHWTLRDPFFRLFIGEFGALCDRHRLHILLVSARTDTGANLLNAVAADGFLIIGINQGHPLSRAAEQSVRPVLLLDSERSIAAPHIILDDFQGAYLAATHLIERGHTHLAVSAMRLTPNKLKAIPFAKRIEGYQQAVADAGLPPEALQIVYTEENTNSGSPGEMDSFQAIWSLPQRPTAVLCVSDMRALELMRAASAAGVRIPEELAIVGFDDIPAAATAPVPLTTVRQSIALRCRRAFYLLNRLIEDQTLPDANQQVLVDPVELVVRASS
jgi:alanine racemase